jgi:hypothetical protein
MSEGGVASLGQLSLRYARQRWRLLYYYRRTECQPSTQAASRASAIKYVAASRPPPAVQTHNRIRIRTNSQWVGNSRLVNSPANLTLRATRSRGWRRDRHIPPMTAATINQPPPALR